MLIFQTKVANLLISRVLYFLLLKGNMSKNKNPFSIVHMYKCKWL